MNLQSKPKMVKFMKFNTKSKTIIIRCIITLVFITVFLHSIQNPVSLIEGNSPERDYWPTNGWQDISFEDADVNQSRIEGMYQYAREQHYYLDSFLLVKNGYLVTARYVSDPANRQRHTYSCTKSFTSTLIGKAIEEGYIESVNQKILDFFPNITLPNIEEKENITIHHLLTMTSGMEWNEVDMPYNASNDHIIMENQDNWVEYVLSKPMINEPGTTFYYSGGNSHLLSAIIQSATGITALEYADEYIFKPLGITNYRWDIDPQGNPCGGGISVYDT